MRISRVWSCFRRRRTIAIACCFLAGVGAIAIAFAANREERLALVAGDLSDEDQADFHKAVRLYQHGRHDNDEETLSDAIKLFDMMIDRETLFWEAYKFKGMAQFELGKYDKAAYTFEEALDKLQFACENHHDRFDHPIDRYRDTRAFLKKSIGEAAFHAGEFLTAYHMLEESLHTPFYKGEWGPDEKAEIMMLQAQAMMTLKPFEIALERIEEACTEAHDHSTKAKCYLYRGKINEKLGRRDAAASAVSVACGLDPSLRDAEEISHLP